MHTRLRDLNNLFVLHQIINKPNFPCLADEIAKPRPDMNIKVSDFTVSEKSINTNVIQRFSVLNVQIFAVRLIYQLQVNEENSLINHLMKNLYQCLWQK